jgi:hypothetical protein
VQHVEQLIHVACVQQHARCHMSLACSAPSMLPGHENHAWFLRPGTSSRRHVVPRPSVRRRPRFSAPRLKPLLSLWSGRPAFFPLREREPWTWRLPISQIPAQSSCPRTQEGDLRTRAGVLIDSTNHVSPPGRSLPSLYVLRVVLFFVTF